MRNINEMDKAIKLLSLWLVEVKISNAINFYDINKVSENLCQSILNKLYGYNLKNMNYEKSNYPGIDLGDDTNSLIAFQITSRIDSSKIKESLEIFKKNNYDKIYINGIRFLILIDNKKMNKNPDYKDVYSGFDKKNHILTGSTLIKRIEELYTKDYTRFKEVLDILDEEFGKGYKIDSDIAKADKYFQMKQYNKAIELYAELEGKAKYIGNIYHINFSQGLCYHKIAISGIDKEENLLRAIQCYKNNELSEDNNYDDICYAILYSVGQSYFQLAQVRNKLQNLEQSNKLGIESLKRCNKTKNLEDYISIQNDVAISYENLAEIRNEYKYIEKAIAIYIDIIRNEEPINETIVGTILNNLGRLYEKKAEIDDEINNSKLAVYWYDQSLEIRTIEKYPLDYALTQNNLGNAYLKLSEFEDKNCKINLEKSLESYENALEVTIDDTDDSKRSKTMSNMGVAYLKLFKVTKNENYIFKSIEVLQKAIEFRKIKDKPLEYASTHFNLGLCYFEMSYIRADLENINLAIKSYKNSLKIYSKECYPSFYVRINVNLSNAYRRKGLIESETKNFEEALFLLKDILEIVKININSYVWKTVLKAFEQVCIDLLEISNGWDKALDCYKEVLDIFIKYKYVEGIASIYGTIGIEYINIFNINNEEEELSKSIEYLNKSLAKYKMLRSKEDIKRTHTNLSIGYGKLFDLNENEKYKEKQNFHSRKSLT